MKFDSSKGLNSELSRAIVVRHLNCKSHTMRQLEGYLDLDTLLELEPDSVGEFCEGAMDADTLVDELEEYGPFAPVRKRFCEFLGIGESTLTGWMKAERVPRPAKVAYVLLVGITMLQSEVRRLRQDARELKIVEDGETYQLVYFDRDDTGVSIGRIMARDIADAKTARVLAGSVRAFRTLQETRYVIHQMLERTDNSRYIEELKDLDSRILNDTLSAFEPDKWREVFGPISLGLDLDSYMDSIGKQSARRDIVEPDTSLVKSAAPKTSHRGEPLGDED